VECAACLDALVAKRLASTERVSEGKGLLFRIVGMLTNWLNDSIPIGLAKMTSHGRGTRASMRRNNLVEFKLRSLAADKTKVQ
jgi:hypothetical protein